jgi:hypothetical protein
VKPTSHLDLVPRSRIVDLYFHFPFRLHFLTLPYHVAIFNYTKRNISEQKLHIKFVIDTNRQETILSSDVAPHPVSLHAGCAQVCVLDIILVT